MHNGCCWQKHNQRTSLLLLPFLLCWSGATMHTPTNQPRVNPTLANVAEFPQGRVILSFCNVENSAPLHFQILPPPELLTLMHVPVGEGSGCLGAVHTRHPRDICVLFSIFVLILLSEHLSNWRKYQPQNIMYGSQQKCLLGHPSIHRVTSKDGLKEEAFARPRLAKDASHNQLRGG